MGGKSTVILYQLLALTYIYLAVFRWYPIILIGYLSRFMATTAERNFETAYNYLHKLKQIL